MNTTSQDPYKVSVNKVAMNIEHNYDIIDVVSDFKAEDVNWIYDYPLYFQDDLLYMFWMYCSTNYRSCKVYVDDENELDVINDILKENRLNEITRENAIEICQKDSKVSLDIFSNFIVYIINVLYRRLCGNGHNPEYIRLQQLKTMIKKMIEHNNECKEKGILTNFDKLCNYIQKYMKVIEFDSWWWNQRTKINDLPIIVRLYVETDTTNKRYIANLQTSLKYNINDYMENDILTKMMNATLHIMTRTDFITSRMKDDIELLGLFPWSNKLIKFKYDERMKDIELFK